MIRRALACAALLLLAACGEAEREWPEPSPALWEVVSPEGERGWLFGTVHRIPAEIDWQTPAMRRAMTDAGVLVVEIAELADEEAGERAFRRFAVGRSQPPLTERVPAPDRPELRAFMDRAGMSDADFTHLDTWYAAIALANASRPERTLQGVDMALIDSKERVVGLESHERQFAIFDALSPADQTDLLMATAREPAGDERIESWLIGDLDALERSGANSILADPGLRDALQTGRNRSWLGPIEGLIRRGERPFVAVGAAHMLGTDGLPTLLAARGYTVRRIQ